MSLFFAPQSWPFLMAVVLLLALAVVEVLSLLVGFSLSGWVDNLVPDVSADIDPGDGLGHLFDAWLGWLHIGKVPMLAIVVTLLTAFAILGFVFNAAVNAVFGVYPSALISSPIALLGALPIVRVTAAGIARLIPRDETSAEPLENLVGRVAVVINGTARMGYPAQARVKNNHGQTLYVHVEPDSENVTLTEGDSVLLVKQISGSRFLAIANPHPELL